MEENFAHGRWNFMDENEKIFILERNILAPGDFFFFNSEHPQGRENI